MRPIMRAAAVLLLLVLSIPARGQWTALGDMPRPSRQGNALRFENAQAAAVVTALSPEVIRVRVSPGREGRDHSYAVINHNFGDPATFSIEPARSIISTRALRVTIQHAPFAAVIHYGDVAVRVVRPEYLIGLYLEPSARTAKRRERAAALRESSDLDEALLQDVLRRFKLSF